MRTCTDCGQTKLLVDFTPIKGTRWTHTRCKPCRAARARGSQPPRAAPVAMLERVRAITAVLRFAQQKLPERPITGCGGEVLERRFSLPKVRARTRGQRCSARYLAANCRCPRWSRTWRAAKTSSTSYRSRLIQPK